MKLICALDIGTSKIRAVVAENENGLPKIIGLSTTDVFGMRHGAIVDLNEVNKSIFKVLSDVKNINKKALDCIYFNIGTPEVKTQVSTAATGISTGEGEISYEEIEKVKKLAENLNFGPNRKLVNSIVQEFIVDGVGGITDPIGLVGNRLEVKSLVISVFSQHLNNINKAISLFGGKASGPIFNPISSANSVLSKIQKELGVILIDIGAGTMSFAIYLENKLIHTKIFPIGSANITSDIAVGLKIPYEIAEKIKLEQGAAFPKEVGSRETINLGEFLGGGKNIVSKKFVSEIIEARLDEMFELINKEIKSCGKIELSAGAVLVGGGAKMAGLTNLAKDRLKLAVQIGLPLNDKIIFSDENQNILNDPEYANVLGLILCGAINEGWSDENSLMDKIRKVFNALKP
ncbi:MAG: cell division protein FtsA [Patescibacteria group bacterium]|nr:cell division protein FtsA [Patescibacteria group bacterium]MCX7589941.1 cell division protein FtsA [Patescibacteria group bacterium]MDW8279781.1 cell division protein FtsA [bacterium]